MRLRLLLPAGMLCLSGCARVGAPSLELFGAFFPAWMLCGTLGVVGGIAARAFFVATRSTDLFPYQLFVCTAIGVILATSLWLFAYAR